MAEEHYFPNKAAAFSWYKNEGGIREKTSFYDTITATGKKVKRADVYELLKIESGGKSEGIDFVAMKQEGDARKAIAAAEREEIRLDSERRELDRKWMLREEAEQDICIWTALTRDYIAARFEKSAVKIISTVSGDQDRLPDLHAIIDEIITDACNDVASSGEITVEIRS